MTLIGNKFLTIRVPTKGSVSDHMGSHTDLYIHIYRNASAFPICKSYYYYLVVKLNLSKTKLLLGLKRILISVLNIIYSYISNERKRDLL